MALKRTKTPKVSTVIGQGTEITGNIIFSGGLHLDGKVIGNVTGEEGTSSVITVSDQGVIEGDLQVDSLVLNGTVTGNVHGRQQVELAPAARITGTVYYRLLEMAMGAEVSGKLVHTDAEEQRRLEYSGNDAEKAKGKKKTIEGSEEAEQAQSEENT